jgi:hypothetical protein
MDNRRAILIGLTGYAMIGLGGCQQEPTPSSTATLLNNKEVNTAMQALTGAVDELESRMGEFDTDNWRDVVPEVRSASSEVANALAVLRKALAHVCPL